MKGYTIQHSIDLLEKAVDNSGGGSGGGGTAASVSYSNTSSGLVATNVQTAIDELDTNIETVSAGVPTIAQYGDNFSTTERKVGSWYGEDLYQKVVEYTVNKSTSHTFDFIDGNLKLLSGFILNSLNSISFPINANWDGKYDECIYDATHIYVKASANIGDASTLYAICYYTKTAPTNNSRSKKK